MYKVLIVEDELLFRSNLKLMLDWQEYDCYLLRDVGNGAEALARISIEKPDIIISDVRMPVMDGVQLSNEIKTKFPDIAMIVLSNYDDFEYVRSILKNGGIDYILKHKLDKKALIEALNKAIEHVKRGKDKQTNLQLSEARKPDNIDVLRDTFIVKLLTGVYRSESEIKEHINLLEINLDTKKILAIIMVIDEYHSLMAGSNFKDSSLIEYAVKNIIQEILHDVGMSLACHIQNGKFLLIFSFSHVKSEAVFENTINNALSRISCCLKKFINISVSFSIGDICESIVNISNSYESAERILENRFYSGKGCVLRGNQQNSRRESLKGLSIDSEKQILSIIKNKDFNGLKLVLREVFSGMEKVNLGITSSQIVLNDLIGLINRVCKNHEIELSQVYLSNEPPYIILSRKETLEEIREWVYKLFENLIYLITEQPSNLYSEYIKKAINLIKEYYAEDISQTEIAGRLGITSNYLSKRFKEELGIGFSEYLCDIRLEKAKQLLICGKVEIKDIAPKCGFNNYAYFFHIFKKKAGITPKEYISSQ